MLTVDEGKRATQLAREIIRAHVTKTKIQVPSLPSVFQKKRGIFVTIHTYPSHNLRGCIGIPQPVMSLSDALREAAVSATRDPRFLPLREDELDLIIVEVTVLTKPVLLQMNHPEEYLSQIKIGRDGLIIEYMGRSGLLLPQVPVEYGWDAEEYLMNLCMKAGLAPDAWFESDAKIYSFSGQIFSEEEPNGVVKEKSFDES